MTCTLGACSVSTVVRLTGGWTLALLLGVGLIAAQARLDRSPKNAAVPVNSNAAQQANQPVPATNIATPDVTADPTGRETLLIGAGDLLDITVFDTPELSQRPRVDDSGDIEMIVGGKVRVAGLSANDAGKKLEACLRQREILRQPHVAVVVVEYATQGVSVLGEVKSPGSFPLLGPHRVIDFITLAGGLTASASRTVTLTHPDSATPVVIHLDSDLRGADSADAALRPGDRIVVVKAGTVYVLGDVGRPGGYLIDSRNSISVLQGLALAQGVNRTAKDHASLIRNTAAGPEQEPLDLKKILANQVPDPALHDGDIVYVPLNSAKDWASRGINSILQMAVGVVIYGRYQ